MIPSAVITVVVSVFCEITTKLSPRAFGAVAYALCSGVGHKVGSLLVFSGAQSCAVPPVHVESLPASYSMGSQRAWEEGADVQKGLVLALGRPVRGVLLTSDLLLPQRLLAQAPQLGRQHL